MKRKRNESGWNSATPSPIDGWTGGADYRETPSAELIDVRIDALRKTVTAVETAVVGEDMFVDQLTQPGAGETAGGAADQSAGNGAGDRTEDTADRTADATADDGAGFGAGERAGHTADRAADQTDGAAGPAGEVPRFNRLRMTLRADAVHDSLTGRTTTTARLVTPDLDGDHAGDEDQGVSEEEFKGGVVWIAHDDSFRSVGQTAMKNAARGRVGVRPGVVSIA